MIKTLQYFSTFAQEDIIYRGRHNDIQHTSYPFMFFIPLGVDKEFNIYSKVIKSRTMANFELRAIM